MYRDSAKFMTLNRSSIPLLQKNLSLHPLTSLVWHTTPRRSARRTCHMPHVEGRPARLVTLVHGTLLVALFLGNLLASWLMAQLLSTQRSPGLYMVSTNRPGSRLWFDRHSFIPCPPPFVSQTLSSRTGHFQAFGPSSCSLADLGGLSRYQTVSHH